MQNAAEQPKERSQSWKPLLCSFAFYSVRFFPSLTFWALILSSAYWPQTPCTQNNRWRWPNKVFGHLRHNSHVILLKKKIKNYYYLGCTYLCLFTVIWTMPSPAQAKLSGYKVLQFPSQSPALCLAQAIEPLLGRLWDRHVHGIIMVMSGHLGTNAPRKELGLLSDAFPHN